MTALSSGSLPRPFPHWGPVEIVWLVIFKPGVQVILCSDIKIMGSSHNHLLKCCLDDFKHKHIPLGRSREVDSSRGFLSQALGFSVAQETPCYLGWTLAAVMPSWLPGADSRLGATVKRTISDMSPCGLWGLLTPNKQFILPCKVASLQQGHGDCLSQRAVTSTKASFL